MKTVTLVVANGTLVKLISCPVCNAVVMAQVGHENAELSKHHTATHKEK